MTAPGLRHFCRGAALFVVLPGLIKSRPIQAAEPLSTPQVTDWMPVGAAKKGAGALTSAEARRLLHLARRMRQLPNFIAAWEQHLANGGANKRMWEQLAIAYTWLGRFDEAHVASTRAGTSAPAGLPEFQLHPKTTAPPGPRSQARRQPRISPAQPQTMVEVAEWHLATGDETRALDIWQQLVHLHPRFLPGLLGLGALHHRQGRKAMAMETWQRILKIKKPLAQAQLDLATLLTDHELWDEARLAVAPVLNNHDKLSVLEAHRLLARVENAQGYTDVALAHWAQVRARAPNAHERAQAEARMTALAPQLAGEARAAWVLRLQNEWEQASVPEQRLAAALLLAATQHALGLTDDALATLAHAQKEHPLNAAVVRLALATLKQTRMTTEALRWLERFLADTTTAHMPEEQAWAAAAMAELHLGRGDLRAAETLLQKALLWAPHSRLAAKLAQVQERQQDRDPDAISRALQTLEPFARPDDEAPWRLRMDILARQGNWEQAFAMGVAAAQAQPQAAPRWWQRLFELCAALPCLRTLEHLLSTKVDTPNDADEVHLRLLEHLLRPGAETSPEALVEQRQLTDTGLAPLLRYLLQAVEPQPERIKLAGHFNSPELERLLYQRTDEWLQTQPSESSTANAHRATAALWALGRMGAGLPAALAQAAWKSLPNGRVYALYAASARPCGLERMSEAHMSEAHMLPEDVATFLQTALSSRRPGEAAMAVWGLGQTQHASASAALMRTLTDASMPQATRAMAAAWLTVPAAIEHQRVLATWGDEQLALGAIVGLERARNQQARLALWHVALEANEARSRAALSALQRGAANPARCWAPSAPDAVVSAEAALLANLVAPPPLAWKQAGRVVTDDQALVKQAMLRAGDWAPEIAARARNRLSSALTQLPKQPTLPHDLHL